MMEIHIFSQYRLRFVTYLIELSYQLPQKIVDIYLSTRSCALKTICQKSIGNDKD
jgi:hypothetical protein